MRGNSTFGLALIDLKESGSTLKDGFVSVCVTNGLACDLDRFLNWSEVTVYIREASIL